MSKRSMTAKDCLFASRAFRAFADSEPWALELIDALRGLVRLFDGARQPLGLEAAEEMILLQ